MKSLNNKRVITAANAWGRDQSIQHESFVIEQSDVGQTRENYLGFNHRAYTFCRADVGRTVDVTPTCWSFFPSPPRSFANTAAALLIYDQGKAERDATWAKIENNEQVEAAAEADAAALRAVQDAFYTDTSDINSLENCRLVDLDFLRRMAK